LRLYIYNIEKNYSYQKDYISKKAIYISTILTSSAFECRRTTLILRYSHICINYLILSCATNSGHVNGLLPQPRRWKLTQPVFDTSLSHAIIFAFLNNISDTIKCIIILYLVQSFSEFTARRYMALKKHFKFAATSSKTCSFSGILY
jgi:hypothetical protein